MTEAQNTVGPRRIQRSRTKGWRMPSGAIYVGRPSRWGNPIHHEDDGTPVPSEAATRIFRHHLVVLGCCDVTVADVRRDLRGKFLACWCPLDQPCHADVLLEIANAE